MKQVKLFFKALMLPMADKQDTDALQSFALTMAIAFPVVFMLIIPWVFGLATPLWPAYLSLGLIALYLLRPSALYGPYVLWMVIASILGWFNTKVILALAFYLLIVPTGLIMRILGKSQYRAHRFPASKRGDKDSTSTKMADNQSEASSYWVKREDSQEINLKDPF